MILSKRALAEMRGDLVAGQMTQERVDYYTRRIPTCVREANEALFQAANFSAEHPRRPSVPAQ